jgi:hypothetical protein
MIFAMVNSLQPFVQEYGRRCEERNPMLFQVESGFSFVSFELEFLPGHRDRRL